ncbi:hypothetical protein WDW89_20270 [Deltaproteobacteria bacterium TL4]
MKDLTQERNHWNSIRFNSGEKGGHYESYFQRANHPTRPLAFWIRYTIFCPKGNPEEALGELWSIYFDGEQNRITAAKEEFPIEQCTFSKTGLNAKIKGSVLYDGHLKGGATSRGNTLGWDLNFKGEAPPLLLLDESYYEKGFPKAKALVGSPNALYNGELRVNRKSLKIENWIGSQNHNWGSKHTDLYAWGQVSGFDNAPEAFLECSTARVKIGPLWTPWLALIVLRVDGEEYALNTLTQAYHAHGRFSYFTWNFDTQKDDTRIYGLIQAPKSAFVGLTYYNPPGGSKTCLNTKIARCELTLEHQGDRRTLVSQNRAAFEILTDDSEHGVSVVA